LKYLNAGSISTADGSALVRLGDTTIVCGVKAEIAEPEMDKPKDGFLGTSLTAHFAYSGLVDLVCSVVPNLDLSAICSPKFKPGPPTEEAQVLSDRLNNALTA
jgi:exosome complex component RRP43